ncbi:PREDICTED: putative pentatricopeptide repeat-containing protein At1g69350, mitochondrial [Populus euphratica]|uniref:Pentatricopeptide repeat-containing protein At1g69350, mitochondrial n=1 Tax=Populus euphratica TaxID=75702 RepID=A0AAJ6XGT1_POPEU|nr:PREDICTED: putative pentatricopeptide repeat-containing protein At1g69350, mitochondrial [Populus euphratica]
MTRYMPLFRSCKTLRQLNQLHAHLLVTNLSNTAQASTKLIESYAQMGSIKSSTLVFETYQNPDSFMRGVLIKCHVWSHAFEEAILLYNKMLCNEAQITHFVFPSVLRACAGFGDMFIGAKVHGRIIKCGFDNDPFIETSLLGLYGELGCLTDARKVFDDIPVRDLVSWSSIISIYVDKGEANEALEMFRLLVNERVKLDWVIMLSVTEACSKLGILKLAKSIHGYIVRRRVDTCEALDNSLIEMYSSCDDLYSAERIFVNMASKTLISWTSMIYCYNRSGWFKEAFEIFVKMLELKVEPNVITIMGVLKSCYGLSWLREGKLIHCYALKKGMTFQDDCLGPVLIELYAGCGKLGYCEKVLHAIGERNVVSWNTLLSINARQGLFEEALVLFVQMQKRGLMLDFFSLSSAISACGNVGSLQLGRQIHGYAIKRCILGEYVKNALIGMYSRCGFSDSAHMIFNDIKQNSSVAWNSIISGFVQSGNSIEAIHLVDQMYRNCLKITDVVFLSAIQACADMVCLEKGKWLHHKLIMYGVEKDLYIETALTDMYAKCGDLRTAEGVFHSMSEKSVVSWSAMISGYGMHGRLDSAITFFNQMVELGIKPNHITFMNILSACSHSGSVEQGKFYFDLMRDFGVEPNSEHFACMVDLLSRAGDVNGAYKIINSMPFPADASVLGNLLNGCRIHQRMDMIPGIEKDLLKIRTSDTGHYSLLSNIYAEIGNWAAREKTRGIMERSGYKKVPGYSAI